MKRRFIIFTIMVFICTLVFAEVKTQTKGISIQAGYQDFASLRITPIAAQSEAYLIGMPFNIEENYVQYDADTFGRVIAKWSVLSNTRFKLTIDSISPLYCSTSRLNTPEFPYILTFEYNISYSKDGIDNNQLSGEWRIVSDDASTYSFTLPDEVVSSDNFFIGSVSGNVYFMFAETMDWNDTVMNVTDVVRSDDAPPGSYYAIVKVSITAEEGDV